MSKTAIALKIIYVLSLVLTILAPVQTVMLSTGALIILDLVTGLWRSLKAKKKITSNGLRRTVGKMCAFQIAIVTAFLMEQYLLVGVPVVKVMAGLIAAAEGKSIMENISSITGVNLINALLKQLQIPRDEDKR